MTFPTAVKNVLLVGGDENNFTSITVMLGEITGDQYSLYWHKNETPSIRLISSGLYDFVILINKTGPSGILEFGRQVKKQAFPIRCIMLTAWDSTRNREIPTNMDPKKVLPLCRFMVLPLSRLVKEDLARMLTEAAE
jgi:hypothetical protein